MDIDHESLKKYPEVDIIGHCLWEMTFYGFTQEIIKEQLAQLEKEAEEAKKNPSSLRKLVKSKNGEEFFWEDEDGNSVPFLESPVQQSKVK